MKAIVLTYDRNAIIARHMIACYNELWPDHPFIFRIPYQDRAVWPDSAQIEYIPTPREIRRTVLELLEGLNDEEWVYWCIDDKYPVRFLLDRVKLVYRSIADGGPAGISGVLFCRARRMLEPDYLTGERIMLDRENLLERKAYHQIWIHQFLRVNVLRHLFSNFPDVIDRAEIMDELKDKLSKPVSHKLYVTESNMAVFCESTFRGVITGSCLKSLTNKGFPIPAWQAPEPAATAVIGELSEKAGL